MSLFDKANLESIVAAWGKRPITLKGFFSQPLLSDEEFLDGMRLVGNHVKQLPKGVAFYDTSHMYYFNPDVPPATPTKVAQDPFPTTSDRGFGEHYERVSSKIGSGFCLAAFDFEVFSAPLWKRLAELLGPLYERVGHPVHFSHCNAFFGKYSNTPTGVHQDLCHVLTIPLYGIKRLRCWPASFSEIEPAFLNKTRSYYQRYLDQSTVLEGTAGDLLYHPPREWHTAENDEVSASITLTWDEMDNFYQDDRSLPRWVASAVSERAKAVPAPALAASDPLPAPLRSALERFAAAQQGPDYVDYLWRQWLERTSRLSFRELAAPAVSTFHPERTYVAADWAVVEWIRSHDGRMICAANGRSFALDYFEGIGSVLDRIARPPAWTVTDLERAFASRSVEARQVRHVAEECVLHGMAVAVSS